MYTEDEQWTVTVLPDGVLEVRRTTIVNKDGTKVAETNWRIALAPGEDVSTYSEVVSNIAATVWTPEVIAAWKAKVQEAKDALPQA